jgi:hypothetical protein
MVYTVGARTHAHTHTQMHVETREDVIIFCRVFIFLQSLVAVTPNVREVFE